MSSLRAWRVVPLLSVGLTSATPMAFALASLEHPAVKIQPGTPYSGASSLHLYAAGNEYESFQVVLNGAMTGVVAPAASALTGPAGSSIAGQFRFSRVGYLDITTTSNDEGMTGRVPDALIPAVDLYYGETRNAFPIDVPAGENRLIWVDLFVPAGTPAGDYEGSLTITSNQGSQVFPLTLTVWGFSLPSTSSLDTAFGYEGWGVLFGHFDSPNDHYADIVPLAQMYLTSGLMHRITLSTMLIEDWALYASPIDWPAFDARWQEFFDGKDLPFGLQGARVTSVQLPQHGSNDAQRIAYWTEFAQHFRQKGWFDLLFDYTLDEPNDSADYQAIEDRAALLKQADSDLPALVTTDIQEAAPYGLENVIDIWVPLINFMHLKPYGVCWAPEYAGDQRSDYDGLVANGKRLWSYQSCMSHGCYVSATSECERGWPSYMVDHTAIRNRIMGWQMYRYDLSGELYFDVNYAYATSSDPWVSQLHFGGNGDGNLYYPGRPSNIGGTTHIPIESIRLKQIRDGLEDYEYLLLLQRQIGRSAVLSLMSSVITNTYTYTTSPTNLLNLRRTIGSSIGTAGDRLSISNVSVNEGASGTTEATFTVTLSSPAAAPSQEDAPPARP